VTWLVIYALPVPLKHHSHRPPFFILHLSCAASSPSCKQKWPNLLFTFFSRYFPRAAWSPYSCMASRDDPCNTCSSSLPSEHLGPPCLFSRRPHNLELFRRFHPEPDHQCRVFQMFTENVFVRSILVHSAR